MENMFLDWLAANSVEIEAFTFRASRDWCPDQYFFRFKHVGGDWSGPQVLPWDMDTFVRARDLIEEAKP